MTRKIYRPIHVGLFGVITVLTLNCEGGAVVQPGDNISTESKLPDTFEKDEIDPRSEKVVDFKTTAVEIPEEAFEKPVEIGMIAGKPRPQLTPGLWGKPMAQPQFM